MLRVSKTRDRNSIPDPEISVPGTPDQCIGMRASVVVESRRGRGGEIVGVIEKEAIKAVVGVGNYKLL